MSEMRTIAADYDVECDGSTVISRRSFQELFEIARRKRADRVVMQWGNDRLWGAARSERSLSALTRELPCDFLVLKTRDLDAERVLLPVEGGPNAELSGEIARTLRAVSGSAITLLHVVDGPDEREAGERFLADWAEDNGLDDAVLRVDNSGDLEGALAREAREHSLAIIGATERGLLSRLVHDALNLAVIDDLDCSVLLVEKATPRSLRERLFGRQ